MWGGDQTKPVPDRPGTRPDPGPPGAASRRLRYVLHGRSRQAARGVSSPSHCCHRPKELNFPVPKTRTASSSAPKKARWSTAQKAAARKGSPSSRTDRPGRPDRPVRSDRPARSDRPVRAGRPDRTERPERSSYPAREREYSRDDRPVRRESAPDGDRARYARPVRREGVGHDGDRRRPPHHDRAAYQPHSTRNHVPGHAAGGIDPEAERIAADSWTKSTRRSVSTGLV